MKDIFFDSNDRRLGQSPLKVTKRLEDCIAEYGFELVKTALLRGKDLDYMGGLDNVMVNLAGRRDRKMSQRFKFVMETVPPDVEMVAEKKDSEEKIKTQAEQKAFLAANYRKLISEGKINVVARRALERLESAGY